MVRGKPLKLGRPYNRRRKLRNTKTAVKATGNHLAKYMTWYKTKQRTQITTLTGPLTSG